MDIEVLEKGRVTLIDHMGSDLTVVNAARVSFSCDSAFDEQGNVVPKDEKLINYLATHNHWTPFAHPQITLRIKAPIPIRTQFFKHKQGFVENEVSRRYVSYEPDVYHPTWRAAPDNGAKQGSSGLLQYDKESNAYNIDFLYHCAVNESICAYHKLLDAGVAPEQARFVLPQGCYTEWYWTGSLSAYARFYNLRIDSHAQWEIQEYAKAIGSILSELYPISWKALTTKE